MAVFMKTVKEAQGEVGEEEWKQEGAWDGVGRDLGGGSACWVRLEGRTSSSFPCFFLGLLVPLPRPLLLSCEALVEEVPW